MKKLHIIILIIVSFFATNINAQNEIVGNIYYRGDVTAPIEDVVVTLYDSLNSTMIATDTTDANGYYEFMNLSGQQYYVRSTTSIEPAQNNISDLYLVLYSIFGSVTLSDIEYEVADVNDDGNVSFTDYSYLFNNIFFNSPMPISDWQFEEGFVDFTNRDKDTTNIWAATSGDVEGIWEPSGRLEKILNYSYEEVVCGNNEVVELSIGSDFDYEISGFRLNLRYPESFQILDVINENSNFSYTIDTENRIIKVLWLEMDGDSKMGIDLIKLKAKINHSLNMKGSVEIMKGSKVLDSNGRTVEDIRIILPNVKAFHNPFIEGTMVDSRMSDTFIINSYPNPVSNDMQISISSSNKCLASINIFSLTGQLVKTINNISLHEGSQLINLSLSNLTSGQYSYKVIILDNLNLVLPGQFVKIQ